MLIKIANAILLLVTILLLRRPTIGKELISRKIRVARILLNCRTANSIHKLEETKNVIHSEKKIRKINSLPIVGLLSKWIITSNRMALAILVGNKFGLIFESFHC